MALGKTSTENTQNTTSTEPKRSDFYEIIGKIIDTGVQVLGIIPYSIARILENFIDHNQAGIKALAAAGLVVGVTVGADGFFQAFGGKALFPFYEDEWIGPAWLWIWSKANFWAAILVSLGVQWIESQAIRGLTPDEAKTQYEEIKHHTVPDKNKSAIDLVEARRKQYKRAGMNEWTVLGAFILFTFVIDFCATFISGRNPWGLEPTVFVGIVIYNLCTMIAGETSFALWRKANGKR